MNPFTENRSELDLSVLRLLAYYEIFKHPLKATEIKARLDIKDVPDNLVQESLDALTSEGIINNENTYYLLNHHPGAVLRRETGALRAVKLMKKARLMSRIIYAFPFVRGVFISGSLSKGSVPEDADIDFFIVTKKHRLWLARTMLVMFKRFFLLGSKKYFCVNYFVDEETLEIPDKNVFTATEVSTLIPMRGTAYYESFMQANKWYKKFYPNLVVSEKKKLEPGIGKTLSKSLIEPLFFHSLAEKLDKYFMKKTYQRWMSMYGENYSDQEFELAFRSRRGTSKTHDKNYQTKVLNMVEQNFNESISRIQKQVVNG